MPARTKAILQKKVRGRRVVYVSSRIEPYPPDHTKWRDSFWESLSLEVATRRDVFQSVMQTGDAAAATILSKRLDDGHITDFVAVLTVPYLNANIKNAEPLGELAHFFGLVLRTKGRGRGSEPDLETPVQFFLAPLDPPRWHIPIRDVPLSDPRFKRLLERRFTWPSEAAARVADEIAAAVEMIVQG